MGDNVQHVEGKNIYIYCSILLAELPVLPNMHLYLLQTHTCWVVIAVLKAVNNKHFSFHTSPSFMLTHKKKMKSVLVAFFTINCQFA